MQLTELSIDKFVAETASGAPVPGGGSISALCGALSTALGQMVVRLTIGKKKYADVQDQVTDLLSKIEPLSPRLVEAVDLDSQAYDKVFQAYKLPKETDQEKTARNTAIQEALKHAASIPLTVAQTAAQALPVIGTLAHIGNQNAITDAYVAMMCARTAILGACANTRINLTSIDDEKYVDDTIKEVLRLEREADQAESEIRAYVLPKL